MFGKARGRTRVGEAGTDLWSAASSAFPGHGGTAVHVHSEGQVGMMVKSMGSGSRHS